MEQKKPTNITILNAENNPDRVQTAEKIENVNCEFGAQTVDKEDQQDEDSLNDSDLGLNNDEEDDAEIVEGDQTKSDSRNSNQLEADVAGLEEESSGDEEVMEEG